MLTTKQRAGVSVGVVVAVVALVVVVVLVGYRLFVYDPAGTSAEKTFKDLRISRPFVVQQTTTERDGFTYMLEVDGPFAGTDVQTPAGFEADTRQLPYGADVLLAEFTGPDPVGDPQKHCVVRVIQPAGVDATAPAKVMVRVEVDCAQYISNS